MSKKNAGGSVLKKLRTQLKAAGIIGQTKNKDGKNSKNRKSGGKDNAGNRKPRTRELANPFETKLTRRKHEVIGQKIRGAVGKPGVSRKRGEEKVFRYPNSFCFSNFFVI
jgi:nucleolar protein 14